MIKRIVYDTWFLHKGVLHLNVMQKSGGVALYIDEKMYEETVCGLVFPWKQGKDDPLEFPVCEKCKRASIMRELSE